MMVEMLTAKEMQGLLHVDRSTIYRMAEAGQLPGLKIGKQWRFPKDQVQTWLNRTTRSLAPASWPDTSEATLKSASILPLDCCAQLIQDTFAEMLEVMLVMTDLAGHPLTKVSHPCPIYSLLIETENGSALIHAVAASGERLRLRAEEKNISLEIQVAADLPEIQADAERLTQVVTNLVDNALRYTPAGTRVTVAAQPAPGGIELFVNDTGPGIPPEELPHVFDRFWRAEKLRNRATGGSGLGLTIVKQLVEAHGGQAQVESRVGGGTRFRLYFPRV